MSAVEPKPPLVERLFAEHGGALQAFFRRRIRSKADAPDLAQEVYLRMLRVSDQDAIRNPVHYLYTVANNLVKEHAVLDRRRSGSVDIDEVAGTATARSAFVVFQQTRTLPLQPIVTGRYRDAFTRTHGRWHFARRHIVVDHVGDVREHLAFDLAAFRERHPS